MRPSRSRRVLDVCWSGLAKRACASIRLVSRGSPRGSPSSSGAACARSRRPSQGRSQDVRHAFRRARTAAPVRRSAPGDRGARVKRLYEVLARQHGVKWKGRRYDPGNGKPPDLPNRCLSQGPRASTVWPKLLFSAGVRPGHRVSAHRQASVICLRCGRCVQVRNRGSDSVSGSGTGAAWKAARGWRSGRRGQARVPGQFPQDRLAEQADSRIEEMLSAGGSNHRRRRMKPSRLPFPRSLAAMLVIAVNTPRLGYVEGWRYGCWRSGQVSTSATTRGERAR